MQIPEYWAEARVEGTVSGRPRVVRRFGWSDQSETDAQQHAERRAQEAIQELQRGKKVPSRERKQAYGGMGLPIREEVIARNGNDVITRNAYGARCLNQPDVLFVDIDIVADPDAHPIQAFAGLHRGIVASFVLLTVVSMSASIQLTIGAFAVALLVLYGLYLQGTRALQLHHEAAAKNLVGKTEDQVLEHVRQFVDTLPGGHFAMYRTPMGIRLLALHRTYDPTSEDVQSMFRELGADPAYAQMCALQACFRARVSPKPWRMDMDRSPLRRVWPLPDGQQHEYKAWVSRYETRSTGFAACRMIGEHGSGKTDARCEQVRRMHDEMSRAHHDLPIA